MGGGARFVVSSPKTGNISALILSVWNISESSHLLGCDYVLPVHWYQRARARSCFCLNLRTETNFEYIFLLPFSGVSNTVGTFLGKHFFPPFSGIYGTQNIACLNEHTVNVS